MYAYWLNKICCNCLCLSEQLYSNLDKYEQSNIYDNRVCPCVK